MRGHKWRGVWPWPISREEADRDYVENCWCSFCAACRELGLKP